MTPRVPGERSGFLLAIDHVQLTIPPGEEHLEAARRCYTEAFGLREIEKPEELRARGGLWFEGGDAASGRGFQVHLGVEEPLETRRHPAFVTNDLAALRARCKAAGLRILDDVPLAGRERFHVFDPFGNRIEMLQWT